MLKKWSLVLAAWAVATLPLTGHAADKTDSIVIGMILEPPGLDPTTGAAAAIGQVVHYNILEGLLKIEGDGKLSPLLAEKWEESSDAKTYTFHLRKGVTFSNGEPLTAADVKWTFERDGAAGSTNKEKPVFANIASIETPDETTAVLHLTDPNPNLLFNLAENTGVILEPKSATSEATLPVGTGPYKFEAWVKGASITLLKWDGYRDAAKVRINKATFRFINDPAAEIAALLAGDIDAFPLFGAPDSIKQFQHDPRFTVLTGATECKTIVAINNKRKPFDDVRVRRALAYAIDRKAVMAAGSAGLGEPIGSHYTPTDPGYIDLINTYPFDPEKAKALLKEAGVQTPLEVTLKLPPPPYARQGGEVIAAELAKVGIDAKIENVEWAQWLDSVLKNKNYDLTVICHAEPRDLNIYANPDYYFQYDSAKYRAIYDKISTTAEPFAAIRLIELAQHQLTEDAVNVFLYAQPQITVAKKGVKGLWRNMPIFANDLAALHWN